METLAGSLNLKYFIISQNNPNTEFFVGGGVTLISWKHDISMSMAGLAVSDEDSETEFGLNVEVGLSYRFSDKAKLFIRDKYLFLSEVNGRNGYDDSIDFGGNVFSLGIGFEL